MINSAYLVFNGTYQTCIERLLPPHLKRNVNDSQVTF